MTRIVLTRHGHVEGLEPERFRGRIELALTDQGRAEARRTAAFIAAHWRPAAVYASPMGRCQATAEEIARACGGPSPAVLEAINDLDYGDWQWRTHHEAHALNPDLFGLWRSAPHLVRFPGGESLQDLVARTGDALRTMLDRHPQETVVLVGHDAVNRTLLLQLLDQPLSAYRLLRQDPCGVSEIEVDPPRIEVLRVNETGHLA